ncbi:hypothetical protein [Chthonobacter albigriseus]|uniref:hypothetical protein n=1 Tax=Chthonobacter albigriseus TaxID=1683161 RepID=UPI0015EE501F|nr:hypothetical protein [Chthonobacter albigriseus]
MSETRLSAWLTAAGGLAVAAAIGWWALVFGQVVANDYMTVLQAAPCALNTDDLCSLAQALCTDGHFLGIKRYSAGLLWTGVALLSAGSLLPIVRRR